MTEEAAGARDLSRCFGHHRAQSLDYALRYCLSCRKLKSCVQKSWGTDRKRRWQQEDWWEVQPRVPAGRRPPWPSSPPQEA